MSENEKAMQDGQSSPAYSMMNNGERSFGRSNMRGPGPVTRFFNKLLSLFGLRHTTLKESLEEVIEEHEDAVHAGIDTEERHILRNVLTFSELKVENVMVPAADIVYIDYTTSYEELKAMLASGDEYSHTRMPVCKSSLDNIIGFLHIKDLVPILCNGHVFNMDEMIRQVLFVAPSMKASDLLLKMRISRVHMAIVVDEYGGTAGLATMEDIMEEIVGEIEDEHDITGTEDFIELSDTLIEASARMKVTDLEQKFGLSLMEADDSEGFDSLGGLIFFYTGRVPVVGEVIEHPAGIEFEITEADPRSIKRVLVRKKT